MYSVKLHKAAAKELAKLPRSVQEKIADLIAGIKRDPFNGARKLKLSTSHQFPVLRRRTGDYRVIYSVHGNELVVLVIAVGNRKDVYKSLGRLK